MWHYTWTDGPCHCFSSYDSLHAFLQAVVNEPIHGSNKLALLQGVRGPVLSGQSDSKGNSACPNTPQSQWHMGIAHSHQ